LEIVPPARDGQDRRVVRDDLDEQAPVGPPLVELAGRVEVARAVTERHRAAGGRQKEGSDRLESRARRAAPGVDERQDRHVAAAGLLPRVMTTVTRSCPRSVARASAGEAGASTGTRPRPSLPVLSARSCSIQSPNGLSPGSTARTTLSRPRRARTPSAAPSIR